MQTSLSSIWRANDYNKNILSVYDVEYQQKPYEKYDV